MGVRWADGTVPMTSYLWGPAFSIVNSRTAKDTQRKEKKRKERKHKGKQTGYYKIIIYR